MKRESRSRWAVLLVFALILGCFGYSGGVRAESSEEDNIEYIASIRLAGDDLSNIDMKKDSESGLNEYVGKVDLKVVTATGSAAGAASLPGIACGSSSFTFDLDNFIFSSRGENATTGRVVSGSGVSELKIDVSKGTVVTGSSIKVENPIAVEDTKIICAEEIVENGDKQYQLTVQSDMTEISKNVFLWYKGEHEDVTYIYCVGALELTRKCVVTYMVDEQSWQEVEVEHERTITKPSPDPTKQEYEFGGWYKDQECTQQYDFSTPINNDITLYAKWESNPSPSSESTTPASPPAPTVEPTQPPSATSTEATKPASSIPSTDAPPTDTPASQNPTSATPTSAPPSSQPSAITPTTTSATPSAIPPAVTPATYTVTFMDGEVELKKVSVVSGCAVSAEDYPVNPQKEGYTFGGWYTDPECKEGTEFKPDTPISNNITVYAKWDLITKPTLIPTNQPTMSPNPVVQSPAPTNPPAGEPPQLQAYAAKRYIVAKGKEKAKLSVIVNGSENNPGYTYTWYMEGQTEPLGEGQQFEFPSKEKKTYKLFCRVKDTGGNEYDSNQVLVTCYANNVGITLYKSITTKQIFGEKEKVDKMSLVKKKKFKKYFSVKKSKGKIESKKYTEKKAQVKIVTATTKETIKIKVSVGKLPVPTVKAKKGKAEYYAEGKAFPFKLKYKHIKGAKKIRSFYSRKKNAAYKKGNKSLNKKKNAELLLLAGDKIYFKITAYYGSGKKGKISSKAIPIKG